MHLCNDNTEKYAQWLSENKASQRIAKPKQAPPARLSSAGFLTDDKNSVAINLDRLRDEHKRPVWEWIKQNDPALAALLSADADFLAFKNALKAKFDATVVVRLPIEAARTLKIIR